MPHEAAGATAPCPNGCQAVHGKTGTWVYESAGPDSQWVRCDGPCGGTGRVRRGPTTHEAAFMAEILAHPEDDAPRLAFADWLDENGQPERAEFVRVQVRLAGMRWTSQGTGELSWRDLADALRRREREILNANGFNWTKGLIGTPWAVSAHENGLVLLEFGKPNVMGGAYFRRGFVEALTCPAADFLAHADALTAAAPIREVRLTTWPVVEVRHEAENRRVVVSLPPRLGFVGKESHIYYERFADEVEPNFREAILSLLRESWRRIDFMLPPVEVHWDGPAGDIGASLRALRDQFIRGA